MRRLYYLLPLILLAGVVGCADIEAPAAVHSPTPPTPQKRQLGFDLASLVNVRTSREQHQAQVNSQKQISTPVEEERVAKLPPPPGGEKMELSGPLADGKDLDWEKYRGKVVIILNWASWCPHCRTAISQMEQAIKAFEDKPFAVIGVNVDNEPKAGLDFIKSNDLSFENIIDAKQKNAMQLKYPIKHVPYYYVVNKAGQMVDFEVQGANLNARIEPLFAQAYDPKTNTVEDPQEVEEPVKRDPIPEKVELSEPQLLGEPLEDRITAANGTEPLRLFGPTYAGKEFYWSDYRGRVVMVVFWASWCQGCKEFLPHLEGLSQFVRDRNFEIVTVNVDENPADAKAFLKTIKMPYETIMDGEQNMDLSQEYPTTFVPTIVIVNKAGNITKLSLRDSSFITELKNVLREPYAGAKPEIRNKETATLTSNVSTALREEQGLVEAGPGSGLKGRGYGEDPLTYALKARWSAAEKLAFDAQIPNALKVYQATNDRPPATHEEFMEKIVKENGINLPELPPGDEYVYVPSTGKLMIRPAKK